eukprot:TRINITY_DN8409_c0_g1_i1.p1 TRINITY_DN8409_c0_g1~~TRINITY_DN8409_c0_g1_i1.p1  ORF type:complete len:210 (+),score=63.88 TRINITY_DN8409_c0_g1_i1:17-646(+)
MPPHSEACEETPSQPRPERDFQPPAKIARTSVFSRTPHSLPAFLQRHSPLSTESLRILNPLRMPSLGLKRPLSEISDDEGDLGLFQRLIRQQEEHHHHHLDHALIRPNLSEITESPKLDRSLSRISQSHENLFEGLDPPAELDHGFDSFYQDFVEGDRSGDESSDYYDGPEDDEDDLEQESIQIGQNLEFKSFEEMREFFESKLNKRLI